MKYNIGKIETNKSIKISTSNGEEKLLTKPIYNGDSIVVTTDVDLRSYINQGKIPLNIEVPKASETIIKREEVETSPIPNTGTNIEIKFNKEKFTQAIFAAICDEFIKQASEELMITKGTYCIATNITDLSQLVVGATLFKLYIASPSKADIILIRQTESGIEQTNICKYDLDATDKFVVNTAFISNPLNIEGDLQESLSTPDGIVQVGNFNNLLQSLMFVGEFINQTVELNGIYNGNKIITDTNIDMYQLIKERKIPLSIEVIGGNASIQTSNIFTLPNTGTLIDYDNKIYINNNITPEEFWTLGDNLVQAYSGMPDKIYVILASTNQLLIAIKEVLIPAEGQVGPQTGIILQIGSSNYEYSMRVARDNTTGIFSDIVYDSGFSFIQEETGELLSMISPQPALNIEVGTKNNLLTNLIHCEKINFEPEVITLSGSYDGTKIISQNSLVDLRPYINNKKLPLDIQTGSSIKINADQLAILNTGDLSKFNDTIYFDMTVPKEQVVYILRQLQLTELDNVRADYPIMTFTGYSDSGSLAKEASLVVYREIHRSALTETVYFIKFYDEGLFNNPIIFSSDEGWNTEYSNGIDLKTHNFPGKPLTYISGSNMAIENQNDLLKRIIYCKGSYLLDKPEYDGNIFNLKTSILFMKDLIDNDRLPAVIQIANRSYFKLNVFNYVAANDLGVPEKGERVEEIYFNNNLTSSQVKKVIIEFIKLLRTSNSYDFVKWQSKTDINQGRLTLEILNPDINNLQYKLYAKIRTESIDDTIIILNQDGWQNTEYISCFENNIKDSDKSYNILFREIFNSHHFIKQESTILNLDATPFIEKNIVPQFIVDPTDL